MAAPGDLAAAAHFVAVAWPVAACLFAADYLVAAVWAALGHFAVAAVVN